MNQAQLIGITLLVVSIGSDAIVLFLLSQKKLTRTTRTVWTMAIILFPALGALAFLIGGSHDKRARRL